MHKGALLATCVGDVTGAPPAAVAPAAIAAGAGAVLTAVGTWGEPPVALVPEAGADAALAAAPPTAGAAAPPPAVALVAFPTTGPPHLLQNLAVARAGVWPHLEHTRRSGAALLPSTCDAAPAPVDGGVDAAGARAAGTPAAGAGAAALRGRSS